jgi:hypothetical protein
MSANLSFELYFSRQGRWLLDSLYDDKEMAVYEARKLLRRGGCEAVRVIEERFDADSGEARSSIVFANRQRDEGQGGPFRSRRPTTSVGDNRIEDKGSRKGVAVRILSLFQFGVGSLILAAILCLFAVLRPAG